MRFLAFSDPHCGEFTTGPTVNGVNQRVVDLIGQVNLIRQHALYNSIKHVIIPGDMFKTKHPSMFVLSAVAELLYLFRSMGITVWIIIGNHDEYLAEGQAHAMSVFKYMRMPQIYIFDKPEGVEIEGVKFLFFPFAGTPQDAKLQQAIASTGTADVLVMHGSIEGALVSHKAEYEIHDPDEIKFETVAPFRLVVAGHLHQQHNLGHVWYPGSIERLTFDDEGSNKGFLDITIEPKGEPHVVPVALPARQMMTLRQSDLPKVVADLVSVKDAIVRVVDAEWNPQDIRNELMKRGCYHVASIQGKVEIHGVEIPQEDHIEDAQFVDLYAEKVSFKGDLPSARTTIVDMLNGEGG
jgi:DNA repair exonuclease SbcCD nuclease subunit